MCVPPRSGCAYPQGQDVRTPEVRMCVPQRPGCAYPRVLTLMRMRMLLPHKVSHAQEALEVPENTLLTEDSLFFYFFISVCSQRL